MKEESKFFAIDAAIEIAENPKYEEVVPTRLENLKGRKETGVVKIPFNKIVKSSVYTRWNNVETSEAAKAEGRLKTIETLKNSMVFLMDTRSPLEGNLEKLEKNIKSLERLQAKGIIKEDDMSVQIIKDRATKHLTENPKGDFEEEIDEILGDPIEEVEIPKEETPKEEGEK
tara:strand:+ start:181 stop:696 length:516 start_codon:yes stop_codon:yes gene_type:complete